MLNRLSIARCALLTLAGAGLGHAQSGTVIVNGTGNIFAAGGNASLSSFRQGGTLPARIALAAGTGRIAVFNATGSWLAVPPGFGTPNAPDGEDFTANFNAVNRIAGIQAPAFNFLTGVFLGAALPDLAPPRRSYLTTADLGQQVFDDILLGQTFFIGDGLTPSGLLQSFLVPDGAEFLYLGTMDGADGSPDFFDDNTGQLSVAYTIGASTVVPEPAAGAMLAVGVIVMLGVAPRRRR